MNSFQTQNETSLLGLRLDPANQKGRWVCTRLPQSDGEVVDGHSAAGGFDLKVDLGFGLRLDLGQISLGGSPVLQGVVASAFPPPYSFVLCSPDKTRVQPLIHPLPSASIPPMLQLLAYLCRVGFSGLEASPFRSELRLEWTAMDEIAGPRPGQPCSPVLMSQSPLGRSAVPQTVLRLLTLLISSLATGSGIKAKK
ncbi:hypothetical protein DY000_02010124 [Brassica cretica]|uniref:Uncharacterized protein n=1 Tax=Brassica cretica TaxID=69181 RepID=A0ABQ7C3D5_BRACR|nr:hypothetical protein DY000_02010124 [Brassica cretica]